MGPNESTSVPGCDLRSNLYARMRYVGEGGAWTDLFKVISTKRADVSETTKLYFPNQSTYVPVNIFSSVGSSSGMYVSFCAQVCFQWYDFKLL